MDKPPVPVTARCPVRTALELLGGKWKLLILYQLEHSPARLSALKARIPDISEKMLIQELKVMVDSGLVHRKNFGEVPPRVEYRLTEKGRLAMPVIAACRAFGQAYVRGLRE